MAMDVAELGVVVESNTVPKATERLGAFAAASKIAESASNGLGGSATRAGRLIAAANDNIARTAAQATGALGLLRRGFIPLIAAAAAFGGAALSIKSFVDATIEAEAIQSQLAAALKSTKGVSGQTIDSLNDMATAYSEVSKFGDDAISASQALLLTFTKVRGDNFEKATGAILNMATALKTDLQGATLQVGKALNNPIQGISALGRAGIQFSESQKQLIKDLVKTGDLAGAQTIILKELETQFGGSARAARETLGGALTSLNESFGNLFELGKNASEPLRLAIEGLIMAISDPVFMSFVNLIGTVLLGALTLVVQALTLVANGVNLLAQYLDVLAVAAGATALVLGIAFGPAILGAIASLTLAIGVGLVGAFAALAAMILANPLVALGVAIVGLVTAAYYFRDEIEKAVGVDVVNVFKVAANLIIGSFVAAYHDIAYLWANIGTVIGAAIQGAVNAVIGNVNLMISVAAKGLNMIIGLANQIPGVAIPTIGTGDVIPSIGGDNTPVDKGERDEARNPAAAHRAQIDKDLSTDYIGGAVAAYNRSTQAAAPAAVELTTANTGLADSFDDVGGAAGGAAGGAKNAADEFQKIVDGANEKIATLEAEKAAFGMSEAAANKLKTEQELLNAAQRAGIDLSFEQRAQLMALAGTMSDLEAEVKATKESLDFAKDATKGFLSDLRSGLNSGKGFWESFGSAANNVLNKIIDKVETQLVDALFSLGGAGGATGGAGGGLLGGLFSLFGFASGGYTGNAATSKAAGVVHGQEYVFSAKATKAIGVGNLDAIHNKAKKGYESGGYVAPVSTPYQPANSNRGMKTEVDVKLGWVKGSDGSITPMIQEVSQNTVAKATPTILGAARDEVMPTVSRYQNDKAGGDYRN